MWNGIKARSLPQQSDGVFGHYDPFRLQCEASAAFGGGQVEQNTRAYTTIGLSQRQKSTGAVGTPECAGDTGPPICFSR
jgi:hypothetical protein